MSISREDLRQELERYATREELHQELERFATREELRQELERFATKEDLERFATKEDLERFATKEDLERSTTGAVREMLDGANELYEKYMRRTQVVFESAMAEMRTAVEDVAALREKVSKHDCRLNKLEKRVDSHEIRLNARE